MSKYVVRFQVICQRCAANQLEDVIISSYFIEGLQEHVMREVVAADPHIVDKDVAGALAVERVEHLLVKAMNIVRYPIDFLHKNPGSTQAPWAPTSVGPN